MTDHGSDSLLTAEKGVPNTQNACKAQLRRLLGWLGDQGELKSPTQLRHEGDGIYAVRARCGLRAYGWFCKDKDGKDLFIVEHVVLKKQQKMNKGDFERTDKERKAYDESIK